MKVCGVRGRGLPMLRLTIACGLAMLGFTGAASAATYTVTTTADSNDGACTVTQCSLRDAVAGANASGGATTIVLPPGTYTLSSELPEITSSSVDLALSGAGARSTTISANKSSRIFENQVGTVAISGVTLTNGFNNDTTGTLGSAGGALNNGGTMTLTDVAVTNSIYEGQVGGGALANSGDLTLDRVTVSGNQASGDGGGIWMFGPNKTMSITDSTIDGNSVNASLLGVVPGAQEFGGGIEIDEGTMRLTSTTVAHNTLNPVEPGNGGGILATTFQGAVVISQNSIVAHNTTDCGFIGSGPLTSVGSNLDSDGSCFAGSSDLHGNPLLEPLADSGGQTDTLALRAGSPAIDAGQGSGCPAVDQRGVARPQGTACDLGAYESTAPIVAGGAPSAVTTNSASITGTVNPDDQSTFAYVEYGTSTTYGSATAGRFVGLGYGPDPVAGSLTGLIPGTTYHFRIIGVSGIGTTYGADGMFRTASATVPSAPKCALRLMSHKVLASGRSGVGVLTVTVRCDETARLTLTGRLTERTHAHNKTIDLGPARKSTKPGVSTTMTLRLPRPAVHALRAKVKESVVLTLIASSDKGTSTVKSGRTTLKAG